MNHMTTTEQLTKALLAAFEAQNSITDNADAARAVAAVLCAFAEVIRGPAPTVAGIEQAGDETPGLILAELRGLRADLAKQAGAYGRITERAF